MGDGLGRGIRAGNSFPNSPKDFLFRLKTISEPSSGEFSCYLVKLFDDNYLLLENVGYGNLVYAAVDWFKNENLEYRNAVREIASQDVGVAKSKIMKISHRIIREKYPAYVVTR